MDPHPEAWEFWIKYHALVRLTRESHVDEGHSVIVELLGGGDDVDTGVLLR